MKVNSKTRLTLAVFCLFAAAALAAGCGSTQKASPLEARSPLTREKAVAEFGRTGDMSCYDELVVSLRRDPNRLVRSQAAFALGALSKRYYSVGFFPLVDSLENDSSVFVRSACALSLSSTRDSRAVGPLVRALRDTARGRMAVRNGDRVVVYRACVSDAARSSLESVVKMTFASKAETAQAQRNEMAGMWESWYLPREDMFPGTTAMASK